MVQGDGSEYDIARAIQNKYKLELIGEKDGLIKMKVITNDGDKITYYFDKVTFLVKKIEKVNDTPQGPLDIVSIYSQYEKIDGINYPLKIDVTTPFYSIEMVQVVYFNVPIEDTVFTPNK